MNDCSDHEPQRKLGDIFNALTEVQAMLHECIELSARLQKIQAYLQFAKHK